MVRRVSLGLDVLSRMVTSTPRRGIHLEYRFAPDAAQRGATLANPLIDLLRTLRDTGSISAAARTLGTKR